MPADGIKKTLLHSSRCEAGPTGENYRCIALQDTVSLARKFGLGRREVEIAALEAGIIPERYQRNMGTLGPGGQIRLLKAQAGIAGAGGLGGFAIELLARCGVGGLTIIDSDSFDPTNLNRQLYATETGAASGKAAAAAQRVGEINGAVEVAVCRCHGDLENWPELLQGCDIVLDCLDNLQSRFSLEEACQKLEVPLVHGAIAGFMGQVAVIRPGRPLFAAIYGRQGTREFDRGAEMHLGSPSFTPAAVAARQAAETVKILAGLGAPPDNTLLLIDLFSSKTTPIPLGVRS